MNSLEIRKQFFNFFISNGHEKVESSSLIPAQDPTLLFTNAGMNQFKDVFLAKETRSYKRAVSIQKCVRAGGKHNDLDNVGFTKRHLTFFEMMGNFSFGDYFKKEAIQFAWELLTKGYHLKPAELFVSVYKEDNESYNIWADLIGVPRERIMRFDKKDNFWQMGDTGPCGPCTEIYVDLRPAKERTQLPTYDDFEAGKLLEIWNVVFMQYDQQQDGTLVPLKQTGVDTGMGLERLTCVLQAKESVFETDLFTPLITATEKLSGVNYAQSAPEVKAAFHVLADHIRSSCLIIADGCSPSNEGRGYVLRKIIRRAALFAQKLHKETIFPQLAQAFIKEFGSIYPALEINKEIIVDLLTNEIEQFAANLVRGQAILQEFFAAQAANKTITGQQAFKLYDTYGFPLEVTILASQEKGFAVDRAGFEHCMEEQRNLSGKKMKDQTQEIALPESMVTAFVGYEKTNVQAPVIGIVVNGKLVDTVAAGQRCTIITKTSPFFVATGGQVDDAGTVTVKGRSAPVEALAKLNHGKAIGITITAPEALAVGDIVEQQVDVGIRTMTMNNHTATHLLQAALIELLGKQVKQSGSVVTPDYLRFDFTYHKNLTPEQITWVENRVNQKIRENIGVCISETTYKQAVDQGVIAIFGEKYNPEKVRVVDVPGFSAELCGGTHVPATGVIGIFKITDMSALSAGNRRIFAVTGPKALELMQHNFETVKTLSQKFKVKPEEVVAAVEKQQEQAQELQKQLNLFKKEFLKSQAMSLKQKVKTSNGVPILPLLVDNCTLEELKELTTLLQTQHPGYYFLASATADGTCVFYASIAPAYEKQVKIDQLTAQLAQHGLRGGGKAGSLQGRGASISQATVEKLVTESIV